MDRDPLQSVYAFVERAYVRLQAGDILTRCLEESSITPVQQMVENLIMAGPQSLQALREVLAEASQRKSQIQDDINQLCQNLNKSFDSYGIHFDRNLLTCSTLMSPERLNDILGGQQIVTEELQETCKQMVHDSQDLVESLASKSEILSEIENYLQDWLFGLAYQSLHQSLTTTKEDEPILAQ